METVVLPGERIAEIARWAPLRHLGSSCRCPIASLLVYTSAPEAPGDGRVLLAGGALPLPGGERMTTSVISIREDLAVEEALRLMIDHDVHPPRGPGLERRGILLLITRTDLMFDHDPAVAVRAPWDLRPLFSGRGRAGIFWSRKLYLRECP
jgi:hypothetical protein